MEDDIELDQLVVLNSKKSISDENDDKSLHDSSSLHRSVQVDIMEEESELITMNRVVDNSIRAQSEEKNQDESFSVAIQS